MRKTVLNYGTSLHRGRHDARKVTSTFSFYHPNKSSLYLQENKNKPNSDVRRRVQTSILFLVINIGSRIAKLVLRKENHILDFKIYYKAIVYYDETPWCRYKDTEQSAQNDSMLMVSHGARNTRWGRGSLVNQRCWGNCTSTCKRMKLGPCLIPYAKVNLKSIVA